MVSRQEWRVNLRSAATSVLHGQLMVEINAKNSRDPFWVFLWFSKSVSKLLTFVASELITKKVARRARKMPERDWPVYSEENHKIFQATSSGIVAKHANSVNLRN